MNVSTTYDRAADTETETLVVHGKEDFLAHEEEIAACLDIMADRSIDDLVSLTIKVERRRATP